MVIDRGNGYETSYSQLKTNVRKCGDRTAGSDIIIALPGEYRASLAPTSITRCGTDGMRVDPIHYFFMELAH